MLSVFSRYKDIILPRSPLYGFMRQYHVSKKLEAIVESKSKEAVQKEKRKFISTTLTPEFRKHRNELIAMVFTTLIATYYGYYAYSVKSQVAKEIDSINEQVVQLETDIAALSEPWEVKSSGRVNKHGCISLADVETYVAEKIISEKQLVDNKEYTGAIMY